MAAPGAPTSGFDKEKVKAAVTDLQRFLAEHRDLTRRQVGEFTARYGNPADKAREVAKDLHLTPEEVKARVRELNETVEKRLDVIAKDMEKRYEDLEKEINSTVEKLFAGAKPATGTTTSPPPPSPSSSN